ncbi:unnamed protein product [Eruca vesicaria subsp. sativa]|uniref:Uncharacterized protein n=1 Tax=Eruca vesicaria subsp. sativa TaxID=29727 RepID=A0ABC8JQR1_ERUVS|nr:unnamed protein product [Eruca vesicaria subsp. sativa]
MDFMDSETQEPDDSPYLETDYDMPPPLAPECKSFKWKVQVIMIVHFDEDSGQPIGESGGLLGSWLGQLSNDVNFLPINYSDWRMVNSHIKSKAWEVIQSKFRFDDPHTIKVFVLGALVIFLCFRKCKNGIQKTKKSILCLMYVKSTLEEHHVEQSFSSKLEQNLMEASYVKKKKNAQLEALTTLLSQNPRITKNVTASLDDEYAQVFGPERPGRVRCVGRGPTPSKLVCRSTATRPDIENSEMVVELKSQVKELSDQVKGMSTFIQQIIGTSSGEQARAWAASFAVAFANIPDPTFANIPNPPNPNQIDEWVDYATVFSSSGSEFENAFSCVDNYLQSAAFLLGLLAILFPLLTWLSGSGLRWESVRKSQKYENLVRWFNLDIA